MNNIEKIKEFYNNGDPSHDWSHVLRVVNLCDRFGKELGADLRILRAAAFLHDIVNIPKNSPHRSEASRLASEKARDILVDEDYTDDEIEMIVNCVLEHSYSANMKPSSLESSILQDCDKLDGMGAIGVVRWATVGARMGASYYNLEDPHALDRELDDKAFSLDHFQTKLLKLYDRLNTEPGKLEGQRRLDFFYSFLENFDEDISDDN